MPTPIFPPDVKPARPGVYKTWRDTDPHVGEAYAMFCNWNGGFWGSAWPAPFQAVQPSAATRPSDCQFRYWCGLTEEEHDLQVRRLS